VLGFPVYVQWTALLVVGFIVLGGGGLGDPAVLARSLIYAVAILLSILVHELGHAVVGRRLGLQPRRIVVHGFGGLCEYGRRPTPKQGVLSALAGPGAGLALGALCFGLLLGAVAIGPRVPVGVTIFLEQMVWINVVWSLFNLMPIHPLDGGSVMANGLQMVTTPRRAWQITKWVTIGLAIPVGVLGFLNGYTFVPIILALIVMDKFRR
jgi:membrane-associated protease RseP (regulator of RpoE activity)